MSKEKQVSKQKLEYFWHAIYTKSRSEKKLYEDLIANGIECYLPLKKELKTWSDRKKWVEVVLFTSYVFVKISQKEYLKALDSNYAVCYVTIRGKAVPIREKQINTLRRFLADDSRKIEITNADLKKGDLVELIAGSLKGVQGEIVELRGKHRLAIRFESLGTCVLTEIKTTEVKELS